MKHFRLFALILMVAFLFYGCASKPVEMIDKTQKAMDLMMNAPAKVDARQLRDIHIQLSLPPEEQKN